MVQNLNTDFERPYRLAGGTQTFVFDVFIRSVGWLHILPVSRNANSSTSQQDSLNINSGSFLARSLYTDRAAQRSGKNHSNAVVASSNPAHASCCLRRPANHLLSSHHCADHMFEYGVQHQSKNETA